MSYLSELGETCVAAGIRAYIGLLGYGESRRSRMLFRDTLQLSAALAGGPSSKVDALAWPNDTRDPGPLQKSLVNAAVSSMLASLLVLRATVYWQKVPILEALLESQVPQAHRDFAARLLADHGVPEAPPEVEM